MASQLSPDIQQIHNIFITIVWSILFNIAAVSSLFRFNIKATYLHSILGFIILALTYFAILLLLVPLGFNMKLDEVGTLMFILGLLGMCMLGFVLIQAGGGLIIKFYSRNINAKVRLIKRIKLVHKFFGFFLGILYKIIILYSWYRASLYLVTFILIFWQFLTLIIILVIKLFGKKIESLIVDPQLKQSQVKMIEDIKQISNLTTTTQYVIFANHVYKAQTLKSIHPGGTKIIDTIMNREVDRFLYGMYSAELFPDLPAYSHSSNCLKLIGKPIAVINIPNPYRGYTNSVEQIKIKFVEVVSQKTQIYLLGLQPINFEFVFNGYTSLKQLGQYYSLTIDNKITRLYTTVNFLNLINKSIMIQIFKITQSQLELDRFNNLPKNEDQQIVCIRSTSFKQKLLSKDRPDQTYLPIMLKIYNDGRFTSQLKRNNFKTKISLKLSIPLGKGLELNETPGGKIIIVAGGTGLFPFSDLIDLVFKEQLISQSHNLSQIILKHNPILQSFPFAKFSFLLLLAINEPEDIHPITLHQLMKLSFSPSKFKIVMRIKKNQDNIANLKSKIQFTKDYFTKRLLSQVTEKGFSKIWICGPPKMNEDTAKSLLQNGLKSSDFLFI